MDLCSLCGFLGWPGWDEKSWKWVTDETLKNLALLSILSTTLNCKTPILCKEGQKDWVLKRKVLKESLYHLTTVIIHSSIKKTTYYNHTQTPYLANARLLKILNNEKDCLKRMEKHEGQRRKSYPTYGPHCSDRDLE